jgi:hypothetical protein
MRIVSWFSCGAASAVATKLAVTEARLTGLPIVIAYTHVKEEHPDNARFLAECEAWFGVPITILRNERYEGSCDQVFIKERYLVGPSGAPCTKRLKKGLREEFEQPGDTQVFGYTSEEQDRADKFIDNNNHVRLSTPLIDRGMTKGDCLAMLRQAGIELPAMYKLGYKNNNCIGCVKGGAGYWNKIRVDFPQRFEQMARIEEYLGRTICKITENKVTRRVSLRELPVDVGRYEAEPDIECGIACTLAVADGDGADLL